MSKLGAGIPIDYTAIVNAAVESILVTTADLDPPGPLIVYVNTAFEKMTGWSSSEVLGKSPKILQGSDTDPQIFNDMWEKLNSLDLWEGQTLNYKKDGSEFWMEWSIVPLKDDLDRAYQYLAVQRDVTARIEAGQRLQVAQSAASAAERARANLSRYFPPKLVETLAAKDKPLGKVRQQNLAVLFADIVGFTRLSEALEPEQVIDLLREFHSWMEKAIFKWDGSIEGYVGDEVIAIFGFPEACEKTATNALACAYELLIAARHWNEQRVDMGLLPIRIGVGVQYGPVVLGDVGTEDFVEFTVIGDTVNIASRLQKATRALHCDLVVGQDLVNAIQVENKFENFGKLLEMLKKHGDLQIRGRNKPVEVWTSTTASMINTARQA
jgi:PAS domain S-box-containing protein